MFDVNFARHRNKEYVCLQNIRLEVWNMLKHYANISLIETSLSDTKFMLITTITES